MPSRGPFGLSGRRLHVCLLSFFLVSMFLWSQRNANSNPDQRVEDKLYDHSGSADLKEGLAEWEAGGAGRTKPTTPSDQDQVLPESELSHPSCRPTRVRDAPGHITAFLIMVHSPETLEGARRLVEQIYDPHDYFLIHADKKLDANLYHNYTTALSVCGNIHFVPDDERVSIGWGDIVSLPRLRSPFIGARY